MIKISESPKPESFLEDEQDFLMEKTKHIDAISSDVKSILKNIDDDQEIIRLSTVFSRLKKIQGDMMHRSSILRSISTDYDKK